MSFGPPGASVWSWACACHARRRRAFDVGDLAADVATVEALARLALVTRRAGCPLALRRASPELERARGVLRAQRRARRRARAGSPNSGNSRAVSRNVLSPVIRPPEISSTPSAHGSKPPPALARYWP